MAWTYSGNPSSSLLDEVRFLIGDTDSTFPLLQDEEIQYTLTENSDNKYLAAADSCDAIASKFAVEVDNEVADTMSKDGDLYSHYTRLADKLRKKASSKNIKMPTPLETTQLFDKGDFDFD